MRSINTNSRRWCAYFLQAAWFAAFMMMHASQVNAQQAGQQFIMRVPNNQVVRISKSVSVAKRSRQSELDNLSHTPTLIKVEYTKVPAKLQSAPNGKRPSSFEASTYQVLGAKSKIVEWEVSNNETPSLDHFQIQRVITTIVPLL